MKRMLKGIDDAPSPSPFRGSKMCAALVCVIPRAMAPARPHRRSAWKVADVGALMLGEAFYHVTRLTRLSLWCRPPCREG